MHNITTSLINITFSRLLNSQSLVFQGFSPLNLKIFLHIASPKLVINAFATLHFVDQFTEFLGYSEFDSYDNFSLPGFLMYYFH